MADKYIIGLYQDLEREVTADIARRVKKTGRYTETAELQAKFMREQGYSTSKIQAEVMKMLRADKDYQMFVAENTKQYKAEVQKIIDDTVKEAKAQGDKLIASAGNMSFNNDLDMWSAASIDLKKDGAINQIMLAFRKQTQNELKNLTRTMAFKDTVFGTTGVMNAYQKEVDRALLKVATGTFSFDQAVNDCVHRLAQSGLRTVDYANGRTYQLDTAARMSVRTSLSQMAGRITEHNIEKTGVDLVIVSQHAGSRPEHAPLQNRVFVYEGKSKKYPSFKAPIESGGAGYGFANGIKGINCTHSFYPYWEGISVKEPDIPYDEELYENTQTQRRMERNIRATKREIEAQRAIGGDTSQLNAKLRAQSVEYKEFSESVGLKPKNNRLSVVGGASDNKRVLKNTKKTNNKNTSQEKAKNLQITPEKKAQNSIKESYEKRRLADNLNLTPLSELNEHEDTIFGVNLGKLDDEIKDNISTQVDKLLSKYKSTLRKISVARKEDMVYHKGEFGWNTFMQGTYESEITFAPYKKERLIERLQAAIENGRFAYVNEEDYLKYTVTHEFGHSLLNMEAGTKNFVNADEKILKESQQKIKKIYTEYKEEVQQIKDRLAVIETAIDNESNMDRIMELMEQYDKEKDILDTVKISDYSLENVNEFFAEAFTQNEIGVYQSKYTERVMEVIKKNFMW